MSENLSSSNRNEDIENRFSCKVSSTLNKDVKKFGKQHMFDDCEDTCWNSDQGESQWVAVLYEHKLKFSQVEIVFQGGFAPTECILEIHTLEDTICTEPLPVEDKNTFQYFTLSNSYTAKKIRLIFKKSSDLFGRIVIYHLRFK